MIGALSRAFDNFFGRGEAAVTVPPLDGALSPNRLLDEAASRFEMTDVDCLAILDGAVLASAGNRLFKRDAGCAWAKHGEFETLVACITPVAGEGLAIALIDGELVIQGGRYDGRRYRIDKAARCITAIAGEGSHLYVANGSATNSSGDWQRDLLERNASGSIWRIDLDGGTSTCIADGLAWPGGLVIDAEGLVFSEAWKHRIVRIDPGNPSVHKVLCGDLAAYPGRISTSDQGYWLAMFAPRSQLIEFVLREPAYRRRMMAEVPEPYWVTPRLRSGRSFYESLQGGGVKHLGMLKPWAPTMSAGICVKLDASFQPRASLQSRADGKTHGVTSITEHEGQVFVAARGDGVIVALPAQTIEGDRGGTR